MVTNLRSIITFIILSAFLATVTLNYSLEGRWSVKSQYLPTNTNASFSFQRSLQNNNSRIVYYLNVFSCKLMRYKYIVVDNEIYLTFVQYVSDRFQCKADQISNLRNRIEKTFYFYVVGNQLTFLGPNDKVNVKLTRIATQYPKDFNGKWVTVEANDRLIDEAITASESTFQLCDGLGVVNYDLANQKASQVQFKISKTSGCKQNQIYSALYKSVFYRWKNQLLVYFYDEEFTNIFTMRKIASQTQTVITDQLTTSNTGSQQQQQGTTTTTNNNNAGSQSTKTTTTTTNSANNNSQSQTQNTQIKNDTKTEPQKQSTTTSTTTNNDNSSKNTTKTTDSGTGTTTKTSTTTNTQTQTNSNSNNPLSTTSQTQPTQTIKLTSEQFLGKWTIVSNSYDFTAKSYFFLVLANRIMLYGGCNVYYSQYQLKQNGIIPTIEVVNTNKKDCPALQPQVSKLIQQFKQLKSLSLAKQNNKKVLQVLDKNSAVLFQLQKVQ